MHSKSTLTSAISQQCCKKLGLSEATVTALKTFTRHRSRRPWSVSKNGASFRDFNRILFVTERIYKFVGSNYGTLSSNKFRDAVNSAYDLEGNLTDEGRSKVKDMFLVILQREINKTYKVPNAVSISVLMKFLTYIYLGIYRFRPNGKQFCHGEWYCQFQNGL